MPNGSLGVPQQTSEGVPYRGPSNRLPARRLRAPGVSRVHPRQSHRLMLHGGSRAPDEPLIVADVSVDSVVLPLDMVIWRLTGVRPSEQWVTL